MFNDVIPKGFKKSALAPPQAEIEWMAACFTNLRGIYKPKKVLEFGCGVTTYLLWNYINPRTMISIEDYQPNIDEVRKWIKYPEFGVFKHWDSIYSEYWDLVFIDSSAGCGKATGHHRDESLMACMPHLAKHAIVILHDWLHAEGKKPRRILDANPETWELIDGYHCGRGIGIYRRSK
jgi:hypothetical protein